MCAKSENVMKSAAEEKDYSFTLLAKFSLRTEFFVGKYIVKDYFRSTPNCLSFIHLARIFLLNNTKQYPAVVAWR